MIEWRIGIGWTEAELASGLKRIQELPRNFDLDTELSAARGWDRVHSWARIAREPPGPPVPHGPYERVWRGLGRFHHSDPRIVVVHFRDDEPLVGRRLLLELRPLFLRFLCPAVVADGRDEPGPEHTLRGFSLETLEGHVERGREWFLLEKDHGSGWIRLRIEASWLPGDFPNRWSRLGFHLTGRRYQRAWHRLAHLRLRRLAAGLAPGDRVGPDHVVHEGPPMPNEPVQFLAQRGIGRYGIDVEEEVEEMGSNAIWRAVGLGALSGVRSVGPAALLARDLGRRGRPSAAAKTPGRGLALLAAAEVLADKLPFTPPRIQAPSLLARTAAGVWVGVRSVRGARAKLFAGLLAASAAAGATHAAYRVRKSAARRSRVHGLAVALAEDSLVYWAGRRLAASAPS